MIYRKRHILAIHILLTALLAGSSSTLHAGVGVVIKGSVYGGGNEGEVQDKSDVIIESGTIDYNVYGGGNNADVLKNVTVTMSAGTVKGNIYGGGNLGDIGTIDKTNPRAYAWTGTDGNANNAENPYADTNTGTTSVKITGGTVGPDTPTAEQPGNVFGGGKGLADDFWCEKGMVYSSTVIISEGKVNGNVYGGGEVGRIETDTRVTIGPETGTTSTLRVQGNVFGAGKGVETHGYSALVRGNTYVTVQNGPLVDHNVYGGGEIASVGKYNVDSNGMPYSMVNNGSGKCNVNIPGATRILGDIFGGGKGVAPLADYIDNETYTMEDKPKRMTLDGEGQSIWQEYTKREDYFIYLQTLALATLTHVLIDPGDAVSVVQSTMGNVYGGSENGLVQHSADITIQGNCQIGDELNAESGNIYGGGKGLENVEGAGLVGGDATININRGTILSSIYGGGVLGATKGNVTVNINGGTVKQNVYGGGALAHTNTSNWSLYVEASDIHAGDDLAETLYEMSFGGIYTVTEDTKALLDKTYYRKEDAATWADPTEKSALYTTHVNLRGGVIEGDAYGGALGDNTHEPYVYGNILVDLNGKTCTDGSTVTDKASTDKGCVVTQVFGCNNAKGTPKGDVLVHVYATQNKDDSKVDISKKFVKEDIDLSSETDVPTLKGYLADQIKVATAISVTTDSYQTVYDNADATAEAVKTAITGLTAAIHTAADTDAKLEAINAVRYDVNAVYGGGNKAAYNPVDPATNKTQVLIEGCEYTSIDYVYGGGNAAPVPATDVTVNSAYEINTLFGGGNGKSTPSFTNPGADVGIINKAAYDLNPADGLYGTGKAVSKLYGGEIHVVYGGSNEKGNIVGGTSIEVNKEATSCDLKVGQIYGAGNNAEMDGGTDIVMGCMPAGVIEEIYAGARNADVAGDVKLTITSGTFGRVFGGNKHGGKLKGSITVNVEETGGCQEPLIIGELYGGGNLADYSIYGYDPSTGAAKESGSKLYDNPQLNIRAFTSIGKIFGGGYRAKMVADPTVDINVVKGSHAATVHAAGTIEDIPLQKKDGSGNIVDDGTVDLSYPAHEANQIGAINHVFGGGNLAPIVGNATVNIGTETKSYFITEPTQFRENAETPLTPVATGDYIGLYETTVEGAIIKGSVYGGGNEANITGNTQVNICAKYDETADEYRRVAPGTAGVTIDQDVFGAGKGIATDATTALVTGNTTIWMMGGDVKWSVYGGGELSQVGGDTEINIKGGSIGTSGKGGEQYGNVYGGGKGNKDNAGGTIADATLVAAGLIKGNTEITIDNIVATAGNATYYGVSEGTLVSSPTVLHNIYGGGAHGSVGTFTYDGSNLPTDIKPGSESTGKATITITGGTIGTTGKENGMVFGSSRGDAGVPDGIHDKLAWVYDTEVVIGSATSSPVIKGSVYGSGENGHTLRDASVTIHNGTIGIHDTDEDVTYHDNPNNPSEVTYTGKDYNYPYRGNVYGGGCGTDKYDSDSNGTLDAYNPKAGIVGHNTIVTIDGGVIVHNVYGAGAMGKAVGTTTLNISGGTIGFDGSDNGNVYAAARGELGVSDSYDSNYATVGGTTLNISGGEIKGSAFGGGQAGIVKGSVAVNVSGGRVINDVYGGGALAHTNTDNWNGSALSADSYHEVTGLTAGESFIMGLYTTQNDPTSIITNKDATAVGGTTYYRYGTTYNTTLNLTGGIIGNVYGGGLGRLQYLTEGTPGYVSPIEAMVYGDVSVMVNGTAFTAEDDTYSEYWKEEGGDYVKITLPEPSVVPRTGRVFGCNNLNGTPKGNVTVTVRRTRQYDATQQQVVPGHITNKYEIRGVYGGGNLSHYVPADGKKTSVDIHNCDETSIEKVYGGGNSANVPTTDVTIYGCFDIHYVFGGGNGADVVWRNNRWQENDGANVIGNAGVVLKGGTISDAFIGSDTKGTVENAEANVTTEAGGDCTLKLTNFYGSSKRAPVYGDVNIKISACSQDNIENVYGGSYDAQIYGSITMTVTSGILKNVFGGNDRLGSIGGDITINIEEADDCKPIIIQNLYGAGFNAPYPGAGAKRITNEKDGSGHYTGEGVTYDPEKGTYTGLSYEDVESGKITIYIKSCTRIDNIYGGGLGTTAIVTGDTEVNINMIKGSWVNKELPDLSSYTGQTPPNIHDGNIINDDIGTIGNIYGGGDAGNIKGNATVNIGTESEISHLVLQHDGSGNPVTVDGKFVYDENNFTVLGANITGNVYGGGSLADVTGNTQVNICAVYNSTSTQWEAIAEGASEVKIGGNVFGGGMGTANSFECEKAMVGVDGAGAIDDDEDGVPDDPDGGTTVRIGNGTISGTVYGGGEVGRVEKNTEVTIGLDLKDGESGTSAPVIEQSVFGAGKGVNTHGYSALVRGNSTVTVQADAKVGHSVYGGGELASVGRYQVADEAYHALHPEVEVGMPYSLKNEHSGNCYVTVQGHAEVGPNGMTMTKVGGPDETGHVFGAGKGAVPQSYTYASKENMPRRMMRDYASKNPIWEYYDTDHKYIWEYFETEAKYLKFLETLALATQTDLTIDDDAFVKGSVYGGSENGYVQHDTHVTIAGGQIGIGQGKTERYTTEQWTSENASYFTECASWAYEAPFAPYDPNATYKNPADGKYYYDAGYTKYADGGEPTGSDGHTFYGNVFGGGSGYTPYKDITTGESKWHREAGSVGGNTLVEITGGHILTSIYGGNELTDVKGDSCVVIMKGGTLGVPRTVANMQGHPVTCYLFGGGKGDQRTMFRDWTSVKNTRVFVGGEARIFGSVFGGAEDGHVKGNAIVQIYDGTIGTTGTSYVDGNVFGGGRGFSGEDLLAGSVGGNVKMTIAGGTMKGSVYGGGRLASIGIDLDEEPGSYSYGQLKDEPEKVTDSDPTYGHITINITGGTIGTTTAADDDPHPVGGNVFGGSMGRITLLNGDINPIWPKMAVAKLTDVTINGASVDIKNNVYGGSEYGVVRNLTTVKVQNGTIRGHVFGGGYGSDEQDKTTITAGGYSSVSPDLYYTFTPMIWTGCVSGNTNVNMSGGTVKKNVYGGGEYASVGLINFNSNADGTVYNFITKHASMTDGFGLSWPYEFQFITGAPNDATTAGGKTLGGTATVTISGGTIGDGDNNGYVFGGSKGQVAFAGVNNIDEQRYVEAFCANVRETVVTISGSPTIRTVYGGGEDGHVMENTSVTINGATISKSVFGGGKGTSTFKSTLWDPKNEGHNKKDPTDPSKDLVEDVHSWTAGKVYGNTEVIMKGGSVGWFIYGGGNLASVGKGNYAGAADDYSTAGYGETLNGAASATDRTLWDGGNANSQAFLNSGKTIVTIYGGTVGTTNGIQVGVDTYKGYDDDGVPYGSVFGGSRGKAAASCELSPRYKYVPDFFLGYTNKNTINIGGTSLSDLDATGPTIYGSVYGGGQDGHVRNKTEVHIFKGNIAGQNPLTDDQGRSGNVFGAGSGIGKFDTGTKDEHDDPIMAVNNSSGSVTCTTTVEIYGDNSDNPSTATTKIKGNVYGGGALASVGPPKTPAQSADEQKAASEGHASYSYTRVDIKGGRIGGSVFAASRGPSDSFRTNNTFDGGAYDASKYATNIWSYLYVTGGTILNNAYGGGEGGIVKHDTEVHLTGGTVTNDVYGGGMGTSLTAADVGGNTTVKLNEGKTGADKGCIVKRIFGCNDLNGTPKGHAAVYVYATQHRNKKAINDLSKDETYQKYEKYGNVTEYTPANYTTYTYEGKTLEDLAKDVGMTQPEIDAYKDAITAAATDDKDDKLEEWREAISLLKYDVLAVYGGGDLAPYVPTNINSEVASVTIEGCLLTSIKQVYGGGNAAYVPGTSVRVNEAYEIDEVFGGGNGKDKYQDPRDDLWYQNPGANVGYEDFTHKGDESGADEAHAISQVDNADASDKAGREAYKLGSGVATTSITGGRLHRVYGGSNKRGNISNMVLSVYQESGTCDLNVDKSYGAGKDAPTDATPVMKMDCVSNMEQIFGGSTNADVYNDIVLTITNGTYTQVFGGNDTDGAVFGSITVNIEEGGCRPIRINELYAGGYLAPYSVYGYETNADGSYKRENGKLIPLKSGADPKNDPCINVISASYIGDIYGGGYQADVVGSPHVNVNMKAGKVGVVNTGTEESPVWKDNEGKEGATTYTSDITAETVYYVSIEGLRVDVERREKTSSDVLPDDSGDYEEIVSGTHYVYQALDGTFYKVADVSSRTRHWAALDLGTIDNVFGGGNEANIIGNTFVEIGTGTHHNMTTGELETITPARNAAVILGSVYGGGKMGHVGNFTLTDGKPTSCAEGTGIAHVTISNGDIGPDNMNMWHLTDGNVPPTDKPDDSGHVFGAGQGTQDYTAVSTSSLKPSGWESMTAEQKLAFVNTLAFTDSTEVIINGTAWVKGSVFGGGENGHVLHNTGVKIGGNCQIGNGHILNTDGSGTITYNRGVNRRYTAAEWAAGKLFVANDPDIATPLSAEETALRTAASGLYTASLPECDSWLYGKAISGNKVVTSEHHAPYDMFANASGDLSKYEAGTFDNSGKDTKGGRRVASSGRSFNGNVFGGGSGYFPYEPGKWNPKAGQVEGNTWVEVTGGHIMTSLYGACEMSTMLGDAHIKMTGGTVGVPRTLDEIDAHPVTCYVFGGGKGEARDFLDNNTDVQNTFVTISGGWVYGSVFGGSEDGHVLGNAKVTISGAIPTSSTTYAQLMAGEATKIGTWGTSYVEGNIFGGGRGFDGLNALSGRIQGNATINISGGQMLGSVYGGGRLGSVGIGGTLVDGRATLLSGDDHGVITVNITGGTIGNDDEFQYVDESNYGTLHAGVLRHTAFDAAAEFKNKTKDEADATDSSLGLITEAATSTNIHRLSHTKGGNVFAACMGRLYKLDGTTINTNWGRLALAKKTVLNISEPNPEVKKTTIKGNVYGGGEFGAVGDPLGSSDVTSAAITISGGTIGTPIMKEYDDVDVPQYYFGSVFGGGYGSLVPVVPPTTDPKERAGLVKGNTVITMTDGTVLGSIYGGGEVAPTNGTANITISGGKVGVNKVRKDDGYVMYGSYRMGNVFGAGMGSIDYAKAGIVTGNTNINISGGAIYHNIYGGGALASVGDFKLSKYNESTSKWEPEYIPAEGIPYGWDTEADGVTPNGNSTGTATINITGGTIGISGRDNGMVNGSSRGDIAQPVGVKFTAEEIAAATEGDPAYGKTTDDWKIAPIDPYDKLAWVNNAIVNIGTEGSGTDFSTPLIKGSVYGGGENGHNSSDATVNVYSGTIGIADSSDPWYSFTDATVAKKALITRGNIYGAGCGTDTYKGSDGKQYYNPKAGMVGKNTYVNIYGGHVVHNVYGGGSMGSVGTITDSIKHENKATSFALSWPYKIDYAPSTGKTTVNITGGRIGMGETGIVGEDNGNVYGGTRGTAGDRYYEAHLANVNETYVSINYSSTPTEDDGTTTPLIAGSVFGGSEDGHVIGDTHVSIQSGLIKHSIFAGGRGQGTYEGTLKKFTDGSNTALKQIRSITSGKVYGNTYLEMTGGAVWHNAFGGGYMASVGKGNYSGGADDYATVGYGETIEGNLWEHSGSFNPNAPIVLPPTPEYSGYTNVPTTMADYFLSSGKAYLTITGGTIGRLESDLWDGLPSGSVFGSSRGISAPNITNFDKITPEYCPEFFAGYVNETFMTIGGDYKCVKQFMKDGVMYVPGRTMSTRQAEALFTAQEIEDNWVSLPGDGPRIYGSVYGGGQDGHVRREAHMIINKGVIGVPYTNENRTALGTSSMSLSKELDDPRWMLRGNLFGGGSGISPYQFDLDGDGAITEDKVVTVDGVPCKETGEYSTSGGSVTHFTVVDVYGGTIHRNVYGGGSLGSVGPPPVGTADITRKGSDPADYGTQSQCTVNIAGTVGSPTGYQEFYGGEVYGASRGDTKLDSNLYGSVIWTLVNLLNGADVKNNVFGGGDAGMVKKNTEVNVGQPATPTP